MQKQRVRQHQRPQRDEERFWIPREQEWLTLGEMSYRSMQRAAAAARADAGEREARSPRPSELATDGPG
jgi:hypothetical protein